MTSRNTCRCRGGCGSRSCVGWLTWGRACRVAHRAPHPVTAQLQHVRSGMCSLCRAADAARRARAARVRELLATSDGATASLFSLVAGGESR